MIENLTGGSCQPEVVGLLRALPQHVSEVGHPVHQLVSNPSNRDVNIVPDGDPESLKPFLVQINDPGPG